MGSLRCAALLLVTVTSFTTAALARQPAPETDLGEAAGAGAPRDGGEGAEAEAEEKKEPGRGDFDAGGQVRLPSGPDEAGEYATFNWIALDLAGRYFLLDSVTVNGRIPLAVVKPDELMGGLDPKLIGGMVVSLEAKLPRLPLQPEASETEVGLVLSGAIMREGAMLLSERDFPLFVGDFKPGFSTGVMAKVKLSSLIDFATVPVFVYQSGTEEALTAVQIPTSTILSVGSLVKVSADLGIYTGDDFSFRGSNGGRIAAGGSLTVKLGPILAHAGAGVASLLTGGMYPTVSDSLYVDLNVKYAR
jgi:hypothetical protein